MFVVKMDALTIKHWGKPCYLLVNTVSKKFSNLFCLASGAVYLILQVHSVSFFRLQINMSPEPIQSYVFKLARMFSAPGKANYTTPLVADNVNT